MARRSTASSFISMVKNWNVPRPADFARYIAASEFLSSVFTSSPSVGWMLMPALQPMLSSWPAIIIGSPMRVMRRRMVRKMRSSRVWSLRISTNSSPPRRATVSPSRTVDCSRSAIFRSTSSPKLWPRLSLMTLKWSRSMKTTATGRGMRCETIDCFRRSSSRWRFGSPVSAS